MKIHPELVRGGEDYSWTRFPGTTGQRFHMARPHFDSVWTLCGVMVDHRSIRVYPNRNDRPNAVTCPKCFREHTKRLADTESR